MSLFHVSTWSRVGKNLGSLRDGFRARRRSATERAFRHLTIDTLEERQLLSVVPTDIESVLVNQAYGSTQVMTPGKSVAVGDNGDFVVTWQRNDPLYQRESNGLLATTDVSTVLTAAVPNATDTTIHVTAGTDFPAAGPFEVQVDDEVMLVTTVGAGGTWTVTRAQRGTAGTAHTINSTVQLLSSTTSLTAAIAANAASMTVNANPAIPDGPFLIAVDGELMWISAVSADKLTWSIGSRAYGGTYAAAHANKAAVQIFPGGLTAGVTPLLVGTDANIYARYFTDEVQRIHIPSSLAQDRDGDDLSGTSSPTLNRFTMKYNVQTIEQLSVTAGVAPTYDSVLYDIPTEYENDSANGGLIKGTFTLWFDANGNGIVDGLATPQSEQFDVVFDEETPATNALAIQLGLRAIPVSSKGDASHVVVNATDPHHYQIDFGQETAGLAQPQIVVQARPSPDPDPLTGFLPNVNVDIIQKPFVLANIPVSAFDANQTALGIESYFKQAVAMVSQIEAPFDINEPYTAPIPNQNTPLTGATTPEKPVTTYVPTVSVRTVIPKTITADTLVDASGNSLTDFEITFTDVTGKRILPKMLITAGYLEAIDPTVTDPADPLGPKTLPTSGGQLVGSSVDVLKQSGQEFRVNPWEADSPYTLGSDVTAQTNAAVAMTPDGSQFVITWQSEVLDSVVPGSMYDIYARRFSPTGNAAFYNTPVAVSGSQQTYFDGQTVLTSSSTGALPVQQIVYSDGHTDTYQQVRVLPTADAVAAQRITFEAPFGATPKFNVRLTAAGHDATTGVIAMRTTGAIAIDVSNTTTSAANIATALGTLAIVQTRTGVGYTPTVTAAAPVTVTIAGVKTTRYSFDVKFDGLGAGVSYPLMTCSAPTAITSSTTVTRSVVDRSGDLYTFRVNTNTSNPQIQPAVAMDEEGDFSIVWTSRGQDISFFNGIWMQQFDRNGNKFGPETAVNTEETEIQGNPDVAMSRDGITAVVWTRSGRTLTGMGSANIGGDLLGKVYDSRGLVAWNQQVLAEGQNASVAFDGGNHLLMAWHQQDADTDNNRATSAGVFGQLFDLTNPTTGAFNGAWTQTRDTFRLNSSTTDTTTSPLWPFNQVFADAAIDADGDLIVSYDGYGADVSVEVAIPAVYFRIKQLFGTPNAAGVYPKNNDLVKYFNPANGLPQFFFSPPDLTAMIIDVDLAISKVLYNAQYGANFVGATAIYPPATDEQLGRLRVILENVAGPLRGEANGVMVSRWDADPTLGTIGATYSDSVVNSLRDGVNQRYYLMIPGTAEQGTMSLELSITDPKTGEALVITTQQITIPGTGEFSPIDSAAARDNIETAIGQALGINWPDAGTVYIRQVFRSELLRRDFQVPPLTTLAPGDPTRWQIPDDIGLGRVNPRAVANPITGVVTPPDDYLAVPRMAPDYALPAHHGNVLYEITFMGEAHDAFITMAVASANLQVWRQQPATGDPPEYPDPDLVGGAGAPVARIGDTIGSPGTAQYDASIGMTADGDFVSVYTQQATYTDGFSVFDSESQPTNQNIYYRQFNELTDTAGPRITDWTDPSGKHLKNNGIIVGSSPGYLTLTFNEEMMAGDPATNPDSVLNPKNYRLLDSKGNEISGAIVKVDYGMNKVAEMAANYGLKTALPSNNWQVVLTLDGDPRTAGAQALTDGSYQLEVLHAVPYSATTTGRSGVRDRQGSPLLSSGFLPGGADWTRSFQVRAAMGSGKPGSPDDSAVDAPITTLQAGDQTEPATAISGDTGNYVVVWTTTVNGQTDIKGQRYNSDGTAVGPEFLVNDGVGFAAGNQFRPDVAMDSAGNFVVVWSGQGPEYSATTNPSDIFARQFDANGNTVGLPFRVNNVFPNTQDHARVAMSADGNFVVTWDGSGATTDDPAGVYARLYDNQGQQQGGQFRVNTTTTYTQDKPDVAMGSATNGSGNFVIVWESDQQGNGAWTVYGQSYQYTTNTAGQKVVAKVGGETRLNTITTDKQQSPRVAMDASGNYVATWLCYQNVVTGGVNQGYNVFARLFLRGGTPRGGAEFMVNQTVGNDQFAQDVSMVPSGALAGSFTVVWTSFDQDNREKGDTTRHDYGIYARMYKADGSNYVQDGAVLGEFRVNSTTIGNQVTPAIDRRTPSGDAIIVWAGPGTNGSDIFSRMMGTQTTTTAAAASAMPVVTAVSAATTTTTATSTVAAPVSAATTSSKAAASTTSTSAASTAAKLAATTTVTTSSAKVTATATPSAIQKATAAVLAARTAVTKAAQPVATSSPKLATASKATGVQSVAAVAAVKASPAPAAQQSLSVALTAAKSAAATSATATIPAASKSAATAAAVVANTSTKSAKVAWLMSLQGTSGTRPTATALARATDRIMGGAK